MPGQDGKGEEHDDDDFVSGQADIHTLPKAQRTQGFENFDSFNTFCSKQKLQHSLES